MTPIRPCHAALITVGIVVALGFAAAPPGLAGPPTPSARKSSDLRTKLQDLVIPHIEFDEVPAREAFATLQKLSRQLDPDGTGINFVLHFKDGETLGTVTLNMDDIPAGDAIRYTCMAAGVQHRVEPAAVVVGSTLDEGSNQIETRFYSVNPGADLPAGDGKKGGRTLQQFFEQMGIKFPSGSSVALTARGNRLVVTNTLENLREFERALSELGIATVGK